MKITIEREDLCTKRQVIKMMKMNYFHDEKHKQWDKCINQLIEVINRDL